MDGVAGFLGNKIEWDRMFDSRYLRELGSSYVS